MGSHGKLVAWSRSQTRGIKGQWDHALSTRGSASSPLGDCLMSEGASLPRWAPIIVIPAVLPGFRLRSPPPPPPPPASDWSLRSGGGRLAARCPRGNEDQTNTTIDGAFFLQTEAFAPLLMHSFCFTHGNGRRFLSFHSIRCNEMHRYDRALHARPLTTGLTPA